MAKTIPELVKSLRSENLPQREYFERVDELLGRLDPPKAYVLTCFWLDPGGDRDLEHHRTWGWFPDLQTAVEAAEINDGDMFEEGYYNYVVIEEIPWGSLAMADSETWLSVAFDPDTRRYDVKKCDKPTVLEGVGGFGMG